MVARFAGFNCSSLVCIFSKIVASPASCEQLREVVYEHLEDEQIFEKNIEAFQFISASDTLSSLRFFHLDLKGLIIF